MKTKNQILFVILGILLFSNLSFAAIIYVNQTDGTNCGVTGTNFDTIQAAIDDVDTVDGDTLIVCNEDTAYTENVVVDKSLNVYGNQSGVVVNVSGGSVLSVYSMYVNITNFTFRDSSNAVCVYVVSSANNTHIYNTSMTNCDSGIYINDSSNNLIQSNSIYNNTVGVYLSGANAFNNTISENTIANHTYAGIFFQEIAQTNYIQDNTQISFAFYGILFNTSNYTNLTNNVIYNNTYGGVYLTSSNFNNFTTNNISRNGHNDSVYAFNGVYLFNSTNNTFSGNVVNNNTHLGFYVHNSTNNTFVSSTVYNNSIGGFYLTGSDENNFTSNSVYNNSNYGFYLNASDSNILDLNNALRNTYYGFYLENSSYNAFTNNLANGSNFTDTGFYLYNSANNTFSASNASNNSNYGFYLDSSIQNNFTSNNASYNEYGFSLEDSYDNNLTSNSAQENAYFDLYFVPYTFLVFDGLEDFSDSEFYTQGCRNIVEDMTGSGDLPINFTNNSVNWSDFEASQVVLCNADQSNITNVTITASASLYNNGFYLLASDSVVINSSNSSYNLGGIIDFASNNSIFMSNTLNSNLVSAYSLFSSNTRFDSLIAYNAFWGMLIFGSTSLNIVNNDIANITDSALYVYASNFSNFSNNTITNASIGINMMTAMNEFNDTVLNSTLTFTGNNYIYSTPANGFEIYLSNEANLSTATYNISTDNLDFGIANATDVSLRVVNLSDISGINLTPSSITGLTITSAKVVQSAQGNYYGLNVTNTSDSATFTPRLYYNSSDLEDYSNSTTNLKVGKNNGIAWSTISSTVNSNESYVYGTTTSFSYFAPLIYNESASQSSSEDEKKSVSLSKISFNCSNGKLEVQATYASEGVSNLELSIFETSASENTDSYGNAIFWITSNGSYTVESESTNQYNSDTLSLSLTLCPQQTVNQTQQNQTSTQNQTTQGNQTNNQTTIPKCNSNSDCPDDKYCSQGNCIDVTGECGYATNHAWNEYECCSDSSCEVTEKCDVAQHLCIAKKYELQLPPNATVGDKVTVKAFEDGKPMPNAAISIKLPNGKTTQVTTNANGEALITVEYAGNYTASLLGQNKELQSKFLIAIAKQGAGSDKKTPAIWDDPTVKTVGGLVMILGIIAIAAYFLMKRGSSGSKGQYKGSFRG